MSTEKKSLQDLQEQRPREASLPSVTMGFGSLQSFELMQRAAKLLANSTLVPVSYRAHKEIKEYGNVVGFEENPNALSNCVVALNMAQRMGADPLMVMQNLYIVEGRPAWSSQFIIAAINSCGRYSPLRFDLGPEEAEREVEYTVSEWLPPAGNPQGKKIKTNVTKKTKIRNRTCIAWAIERETGQRLESPVVSIEMALAEGWLTKNGSKWITMSDVMLRYRTASFFGKLYAPELLMGLQSAEELQDVIDITPDRDVATAPVVDMDTLRNSLHKAQPTSEKTADQVREEYGHEEAENFEESSPAADAGATNLAAEPSTQSTTRGRRPAASME